MMSVTRGYKVCLVGDSSVGKSCLFNRLIHDTFNETSASIAAAYCEKELEVNGETILLCIWDTAGCERFRSLTPLYYRGAEGIILVYDITDEKSFRSLGTQWLPSMLKATDTDMALAVVGNKLDLETDRAVPSIDAREYAESLNAVFLETSAKTGENVERMFVELALKIRHTRITSKTQYQTNVLRLPARSLSSDEEIPGPRSRKPHWWSKC